MKKNNKLFVKAMIITAVIGLTTLMITMFIGIKFFTDKAEVNSNNALNLPTESPQVEIKSTILGVVKDIEKTSLRLFDVEKKQLIRAPITIETMVEDSYGNTIPLEAIHKGEMVEVVYEPQKDKLIKLVKTNRAWTKKEVIGLKFDEENGKIELLKNFYRYIEDTLILDENGEEIDSQAISAFDTVTIVGEKENIWSIQIIKKGGELVLGKLPTLEGTLEIDRNTILPLNGITEPIGVAAGNHKIILNMDGYEPIAEDITVEPGGEIQITADGAKMAYTDVVVQVANGVVDYTIQVDGKTYGKGDEITLKKGVYTFKITAPGFRPWAMEVGIEGASKTIQAVLTQEATGAQEQEETTQDVQNATYQISISTDPSGAEVYVGGIYKGTTPYRATLPVGDYFVELKKQGYETYTTSLIIDNSDNQNSYQYTLTKLPQ